LWWSIQSKGNRLSVFMHNECPMDSTRQPLGQAKWEADFKYQSLAKEYIQSRIQAVKTRFSFSQTEAVAE